jgi:hypothetical protein
MFAFRQMFFALSQSHFVIPRQQWLLISKSARISGKQAARISGETSLIEEIARKIE